MHTGVKQVETLLDEGIPKGGIPNVEDGCVRSSGSEYPKHDDIMCNGPEQFEELLSLYFYKRLNI